MSSPLLTHKALAAMLGVSETTVKSYRRKFPGCIPVANEGKPIRFTPEAASVALRIRDLFSTGMSVQEVRRRLAQEFSWITEEEPQTPAKETVPVNPELAIGVSNMAKSMVTITGQQRTILERVQSIEGTLEELGIQGLHVSEEARQQRHEEARHKQQLFEERLARLDTATQDLAGSLATLASQFRRFMEQQQTDSMGAQPPAQPPHSPEQEQPAGEPAHDDEHGLQAMPFAPQQAPVEPERQFFTLPLIVQLTDGKYISAGGKNKGRFSLNDLKAMLVYGYTPPHHFSLQFQHATEGWVLHLTQPEQETPRTFALSLLERMTNSGIAVIEVVGLQVEGRTVHPAEICAIIDSLSG